MFYDAQEIREFLRCPACKSTLVAPKLLPCCQKTVCSACAELMRQNLSQKDNGMETNCFICSLCSSDLPNNQAFVDHYAMQKLLEIQPKVVSRGKLADQLEKSLNKLSEQVKQMETTLPLGEETINEHCTRIRNEVDTAFEKAIQSLEDARSNFVAQIGCYQKKSLEKFNETRSTKEMLDYMLLVKDTRADLEKWTAYSNECMTDDNTVESYLTQCNQLTDKAESGFRWFNSALFANRRLRFKCNPKEVDSDMIGTLDVETNLTCVQTFEVNSKKQNGIAYLKATDQETCDYHNDNLAVYGDSADFSIQIWSICQNKQLGELNGHTKTVRCTKQVNKDRLLSGSDDGTAKLWDLSTFSCIQTFQGHKSEVINLQVLDENTFVTSTSSKALFLWKMNSLVQEVNQETDNDIKPQVSSLSAPVVFFNSWRDKLVSYHSDKRFKLWNSNLRELSECGFNIHVCCIEMLQDGRVAIAFENNRIDLMNLNEMELIMGSKMIGHVKKIVFMKNILINFLISCSEDRTVKLWNIKTFQCLFTLTDHSFNIKCIEILNKDSFMTFSDDKGVKIWQIEYKLD